MLNKIKELFADVEPYEDGEKVRIVLSRMSEGNVCFFITTQNPSMKYGGHINFYQKNENNLGIDELMNIFTYLSETRGYDVIIDMGWYENV